MLLWWGYATVIAASLGLAAWAAERISWRRHAPSRGVWAVALAASGVIPLLAWLQPFPVPLSAAAQAGANASQPLGDALLAIETRLPALNGWLPWIWLMASMSVLARAAMSQRSMLVAARRSDATRIAGVAVHVGADEGPAVFGLLRPRILMPSWIAAAPPHQRRLALVHELSHLRAGDLPLIWGCFAFACAMPWNVAAWWLLHRLRQAVEIDCDRRVVARHADARAYGELLVDAAMARSRLALAPGFSARRSLLRRRIEHLGRKEDPPNRFRWTLAAFATAWVAVAVSLPAPASRHGISRFEEVTATASPDTGLDSAPARSVYRAREVPPAGGVVRAIGERADDGDGSALRERGRFELREQEIGGDSARGTGAGGRLSRASPRRR